MGATDVFQLPYETRDDPPAGYARRRDLARRVEEVLLQTGRIRTQVEDSASALFSAETVVSQLTATLLAGVTYRITFDGGVGNDTSDDQCLAQLREDNISGSFIRRRRIAMPSTSSLWGIHLEGEYTPEADEDKTFVLTYSRTGSGQVRLTAPSYLYVDYVRGFGGGRRRLVCWPAGLLAAVWLARRATMVVGRG